MQHALWIFLTGGVGCLTRFGILTVLSHHPPMATLICNMMGCLGAGICHQLLIEDRISQAVAVPLLLGFLGGLTTFSTFMLDAIGFYQRENMAHSAMYIIASLGMGFVLCILGSVLTRWALA